MASIFHLTPLMKWELLLLPCHFWPYIWSVFWLKTEMFLHPIILLAHFYNIFDKTTKLSMVWLIRKVDNHCCFHYLMHSSSICLKESFPVWVNYVFYLCLRMSKLKEKYNICNELTNIFLITSNNCIRSIPNYNRSYLNCLWQNLYKQNFPDSFHHIGP